MFATWKYDRDTAEVQNIRLAYDPISARSSQHQACDRCHEKKLKCSGEKNGCDRCTSSAHPCVYNRSEARCSRRGKRGSRSSSDSSAIDETTSRPSSKSGSPSRRIAQHAKQQQQQQQQQQQSQNQHRIRKGSQSSRRKSNSPPINQSFGSSEPDLAFDLASPCSSVSAPSAANSPYSMANFAAATTIVPNQINYATAPCVSGGGYEPASPVSMTHSHHYQHQHQQQHQHQHIPYSMAFGDCGGYTSDAAWPAVYPRDVMSSAGLSNSFAPGLDPHAFSALTPPSEYMQLQAYANLQTAGADLWTYRR